MFEKLEISRMAHALASHAMVRQGAIAQNVANADTPGYKAVDAGAFAAAYKEQDGFQARATRAGHLNQPDANPGFALSNRKVPGNQSPNGNTVSLETEMLNSAEVRQQYDMALAIAKMTSGIVRSSLGRR